MNKVNDSNAIEENGSDSCLAKVSVVDQADIGLSSEGMAMLSALTSRDLGSVEEKLASVKEKGAEAFMARFYIGYGHDSIGKCGMVNIFIENVSMLASKALQHSSLFCGQESSTRYIPFSAQNVFLPSGIELPSVSDLIEDSMEMYELTKEKCLAHLLATLEKPENASEKKWEKTLEARAFDIARSLLPCGCTTTVAMNISISTANKELNLLLSHELSEVRAIAKEVKEKLRARYPSSFSESSDPTDVQLAHDTAVRKALIENLRPRSEEGPTILEGDWSLFDTERFDMISRSMPIRPRYQALPDALGELGVIGFNFDLDFAGIRDLARHTKGTRSWSYVDPTYGFHEWYLSQMPDGLLEEVESLLHKIEATYTALREVGIPAADLQYFIPMGYKCRMNVSYPIDNAVYVAELRSGPTVHPTVREIAQAMALEIHNHNPEEEMYYNLSEIDTLDVRRADHGIVEVE